MSGSFYCNLLLDSSSTSSWLIPLVVGVVSGLGGGLVGTVLRLSHDRANELRTRMLEAADDFVAAFTAARDCLANAEAKVGAIDSVSAREDVRPELAQEWKIERAELVRSVKESYAALKRREPRIRLLYGSESLPARAALMAHVSLSVVSSTLDMTPEDRESLGVAEETTEARTKRRLQADKAIDNFSRYARSAILASPWSTSPIRLRAQAASRRLKKYLNRHYGRGGDA